MAEPVDAGAVVIRRTPVSDIAKANTFTATERQFGQLLDTLGARDDLRCSLALWCYPDDELAEIGSVLLPFGHQGLINHGEDNEATITCPFGDEAFVKVSTKPLSRCARLSAHTRGPSEHTHTVAAAGS